MNRQTVYDYKRADFHGLRTSLFMNDWTNIDNLPVDEAVTVFYSTLKAYMHEHIPTITLKRQYSPWFDCDVRKLLVAKERAFHAMKRDRNPDNIKQFRDCRRIFKKKAYEKYLEYLQKITGDFRSNPKCFWSFLKCVRSYKGRLPSLLDRAGEVSDDVERAELFNRTFADKFSDPSVEHLPPAHDFDLSAMTDFEVSSSSISSILDTLNVHKASGPDDISARIIRECANQLVVPITIICQLSLKQGVYPSKWKEANIVPVF